MRPAHLAAQLAALLGAASFASGCIVDVVFDPIGRDASVAGRWTIEGAPPTRASCQAAGIDRVRVRFFEGDTRRDHPDLVFSCEAGAFDTRPDLVLADGVWTMALVPIDAGGDEILTDPEVPRETYDTIAEAGHVTLTPVDFRAPETTGYTGTWTLEGATPTEAACQALGLAEVRVEFLDEGGAALDSVDRFDCAAGELAAPLAPGDYAVRVVAVDDAGETVATAMREDFTVTLGQTHALNMGEPFDFFVAPFDPRGVDAALDASWTIGTQPADALACEVVGGATVQLVLHAPDDAARVEGVVVAMAPCQAGAFTSTGPLLAAGDYFVSALLVDAANTEVARADFAEVTLEAGDTLDATGADLRLPRAVAAFPLRWERPDALGVFADCAGASVVSFQWGLTAEGEATPRYASATAAEPCEDRLVFGPSGQPVTPGAYTLFVEGDDAGGKAWSLETPSACRVELAAEGDLAIASACRLRFTP